MGGGRQNLRGAAVENIRVFLVCYLAWLGISCVLFVRLWRLLTFGVERRELAKTIAAFDFNVEINIRNVCYFNVSSLEPEGRWLWREL